jgi:hypothetical protein
MRHYLGTMLMVATVAGSGAACAAPMRFYDSPRQDFHRWNRDEDRLYRAYLSERSLPYVEYRRLNRREQEQYWDWRHSVRVPGARDQDRGRSTDQDRGRDPDRNRDRR